MFVKIGLIISVKCLCENRFLYHMYGMNGIKKVSIREVKVFFFLKNVFKKYTPH